MGSSTTGDDDRARGPNASQRAATETGRMATVRHVLSLIFLRDWHPVVRDPLDVFRLTFPVGAVIFLIQGDGDAFVRLLLPGVLVLVVRALNIPRPIDWVFCLAMAFQGWGNALHLFTELSWYDNTVHVTLPMSLAPILYIAFARIDIVPDPADRVGGRAEALGMALITMCLGVTAASFYEIYEWVVDNWFGQSLFIAEGDTVNDLADGFLGAGIGGLFLAAWAEFRYTSRRFPRRMERMLRES